MKRTRNTFSFALLALLFLILVPLRLAAQTETLRVAVVGLTHGHVNGFLTDLPRHTEVKLVGIVEEDSSLVDKYAQKHNLARDLFYAKLDKMIDERHPQVVLVYTSTRRHRAVIEEAAQHGVSAMVEKPLTISLDDALAIAKAARTHHTQVFVNYETTWYPSNRAAYDDLAAGKLGDLRKLVVHDGHQGPAEINVEPEFLRWLTDPVENGGGALYDFGCYGANLATWLMHGETPTSVTAVVNRDKPNIYPNVDDDATIILTYPHAQAIIQASWNWPFDRKDMEVYGTTGYVITVAKEQIRVRLKGDAAETLLRPPAVAPPNNGSMPYLAAAMTGKVPSTGDPTALDTNLIVMHILDAARQSARTGATVKLNPLPSQR